MTPCCPSASSNAWEGTACLCRRKIPGWFLQAARSRFRLPTATESLPGALPAGLHSLRSTMKRAPLLLLSLVLYAGCATPPERAVRPLPEDGPAPPYSDLLTRARLQATAATEAFYVNQWGDLEDAAKSLEQTAKFLGKSADAPPKQKDSLGTRADELGKEALVLHEAARSK